MRKINYLVIYASSTTTTASISNIQSYWNDILQWQNPGYHYMICPDGKVVQMLGIDKITNGISEYNDHSINIAYIGGIDEQNQVTDTRTAPQKISILKLLRELKEQFPKAKIQGYRDFFLKNKIKQDPDQPESNPCFNATPEYSHL